MIEAEVKDLRDVDTAYHDLYQKEGDVYKLKNKSLLDIFSKQKEKDNKAGKDIQAMVKLIEKQKKELESLKQNTKAEPEEVKENKQPEEEAKELNFPKNTSKEFKAQFEAVMKQNEELKNQIKTVVDTQKREKDVLYLKDLTIKKDGNWDILEPHITNKVKRVKDEATGEEIYSVLDEKGDVKWNGTERLKPEDFIDQLKKSDSFKSAFHTKKDGSGINDGISVEKDTEEIPISERLKKTVSEFNKNELVSDRLDPDQLKKRLSELKPKILKKFGVDG